MRKVSLILIMAAAGVVGGSTSAQATPVSCPGPLGNPGDRQFQLDTTDGSVCLGFGQGNGQLNVNNEPVFDSVIWTLLDKSDDATAGTDPFKNALGITWTNPFSGQFSIDPDVWGTYDRIILALQSEVRSLNPDWAAFELVRDTSNGTWEIATGDQGLSHANLYGIRDADDVEELAAVPEPASLALLGVGLAFTAHRLRRRK